MARQYAEGTVVSVEKSRAEIETLLLKYGADQLMNAVDTASGEYVIGFRYRGMYAKLNLRVPLVTDPRFKKTKQGRPTTELQRKNAADAEARRLWRALVLVVKAKLEAVASGITTFEREFLASIMLPNNQDVGTWAARQIKDAYETGQMPPLLPMLTNRGDGDGD